MQAYSRNDLYNKLIHEQSSDAFLDKSIGANSYRSILEKYPHRSMTPNYFIRIALGLLTIVAILFSGLLAALIFSTTSNNGATILCIFLSILTYVALELLVQRRHFYNAGVDNLLLCFTVIFLVSTVVISEPSNIYLAGSFIAMLTSIWLCVRFTDAFMACVSYLSFILFIFFWYITLGTFAKATAPFVIMAFSAGTYLLMNMLIKRDSLWMYQFSCKTIIVLTLLTFYAAGNYFVVREVGNEMYNLHLGTKNQIPFGWLFWILTVAIPPAYFIYGILKKTLLFMRIGLCLAMLSILTFRFYYAILPAEVAMAIVGLVLTLTSYFLTKYLKSPRHGFSFDHTKGASKNLLNAQSLIIAQTLGTKTHTETKTVEFGGGSFGGGGSGSTY